MNYKETLAYQVLKENDAVERFAKNLEKFGDGETFEEYLEEYGNGLYAIEDAFYFVNTEEGLEYWEMISKELFEKYD